MAILSHYMYKNNPSIITHSNIINFIRTYFIPPPEIFRKNKRAEGNKTEKKTNKQTKNSTKTEKTIAI